MVINRDGLVWVGRRADGAGEEEGRGHWWQMPQGGIDDGEDPAAAALRELIEETGMRTVEIIGETSRLAALRPAAAPHRQGLGRTLRGQDAEVVRGPLPGRGERDRHHPCRPATSAEFTEWRWVPLAEVADLIVPFKREVYVQVVAAFAEHARPDE